MPDDVLIGECDEDINGKYTNAEGVNDMRCTFRPYEGDDDYIFISYSHEDKERVFPILNSLNNKGFRIWYDEGIEWGTEWSDSIADHLLKAAVCMFFYSKTYVLSMNCKQEISYALKQKKKILPVFLEEVIVNGKDNNDRKLVGLDMQLCLYQAAYVYQYPDSEQFVEQLGATLILQSCIRSHKDMENCPVLEANDKNEKGIHNLDKIIEAGLEKGDDKYHVYADVLSYKSSYGSPLEIRLYEIKARNYLNGLKNYQSDEPILDYDNSYDTQLLNPRSIIDHYGKGRHFSLTDQIGKNTLIFEAEECIDNSSLSAYYRIEQLVRSSEEKEAGCFKRTYYIQDAKTDGNSLIIFTFDSLNNDIYINTGMLYRDEVKITKHPCILSYYVFTPNNKLKQISGSAYNLVGLSDKEDLIQKEHKSTEIWYEAEVSATVPIIIDVAMAQAVHREIYFDENENMLKAKIKLESYKQYLFCKINYDGGMSATRALTPLELGKCYKNGQHGFPKDVNRAIKYLEEDDSADALYEIAHIFIDDSTFQDDESAQIYLQKASEQGNELASIELALNLYFKDDCNLQSCIDILRRAIRKNSHNVMFTLAYILETNNYKKELQEAFNVYYDLAKENNHYLAQFRLCRDWDDNVATEGYLYHSFQKSVQDDDGAADFCLGSVLLYGDWDFPAVAKIAFDLLNKAANKGNFDAQYELFRLYHEENGRFEDQRKAYYWCCSLNQFDSSVLVDLSDWLLDGAGGYNQDEADKEAFSILQHASLLNNKTAINNLGWMYKSGRGCEQNYEKAKELFEQAAKLGSRVAINHLGELYQYGLGVKVDIEQAIQYYKQAADLGYGKALRKIEELTGH